MVDLSIIIPVYNASRFLDECFHSLVEQTFDGSMEILLIEDCSKDDSLQKCELWVQKRPDLFTLFKNKKNQGVSSARNCGLDAMSGHYFTFVDPDDLVPADAMQALYRVASKNQFDIVKGNNTIFNKTDEKLSSYSAQKTEVVFKPNILSELFLLEKARGHIWGKLLRSDTLGRYRLTPGVRMAEDLLYMSELFSHAKSMVLLNETVYRYRNHADGGTGTKFRRGSYRDWMWAVEESGKFCQSKKDRRSHKNLQFRSINQLTRECANLPADEIKSVLPYIADTQLKWQLNWFSALKTDIKSAVRYMRYRTALDKARSKLTLPHS